MVHLKLIPIAVFLALFILCWLSQLRLLGALVVASYCGVILHTFTGGPSGAIWLVEPLLMLAGIGMLTHRGVKAYWPPPMRWLAALFTIFAFGILVGLARYNSALAASKGQDVHLVFGLPLQFALAGYRVFTLTALVLAVAVPLCQPVDGATMRRLGLLCWWCTLMLAVAGIVNYLHIFDLSFSVRSQAGFRNVALLGFHRSAAGLMFIMGPFFSYAVLVKYSTGIRKAFYYLGYGVMSVGLLTTWSRAGLVCFVVALVSLVLIEGILRRPGTVVMLIIAGIAVIIGLSYVPGMEQRFSIDRAANGSLAGRIPAWKNLISWLVNHPLSVLVGVGFQNFNYHIRIMAGAVSLEAAHNMYLQILAEYGVVGLCVFIGWLGSSIRWLRRWKFEDRALGFDSPAGPILALFLGLLVSGLTQESLAPSPSMVPSLLQFFLLFGICIRYYITQQFARSSFSAQSA